MGILAAGLAHELNNPIGSILLAAENARAQPDRAEECLETIRRNARRCADVVRSVLLVARSDPRDPEVLDVNAVVARATEAVEEAARARHAAISWTPAGSLPPVRCSAFELEQAVGNVLRNALESAQSGVQVTVETGLDGENVEVRIRDDGRGVPADQRARVFEPFFTTRQDEGGTGLGLSLVRAIVHECGGTVRFDSTEGSGTRVVLSLPAAGGTT